MIWRRRGGGRRKVEIWWRRFAVSETADGQSSERINQRRAVIGGEESSERPGHIRGGFTLSQSNHIYFIHVKMFSLHSLFFWASYHIPASSPVRFQAGEFIVCHIPVSLHVSCQPLCYHLSNKSEKTPKISSFKNKHPVLLFHKTCTLVRVKFIYL